MIRVAVSAESLLAKPFEFKDSSPELRAVRIIKEMNLRIYRDEDFVLHTIAQREVRVIESKESGKTPLLEIFLNGVAIYRDPQLQAEENTRLQNRDLRFDREF